MQRSLTITPYGKLIDDSWKDRLIQKAVSSSKGRSSLASAMINPIRRSIDYQGVARRALVVEQMPVGGLSYYPPVEKIVGERVTIPEFEIYSSPTIRISEVKSRRFNLIDRLSGKFRITKDGKLVDKGTY